MRLDMRHMREAFSSIICLKKEVQSTIRDMLCPTSLSPAGSRAQWQ